MICWNLMSLKLTPLWIKVNKSKLKIKAQNVYNKQIEDVNKEGQTNWKYKQNCSKYTNKSRM